MRAALALLLVAPTLALADPPTVAPADILATVQAALATPDPAAPRGKGHVIAYLAKVDVATEVRALRAALAQPPWKIIDEFSTDALAVITVEGATGARATISLGSTRGEIGVTDRPAAVRAPGPCVPIPQVAHEVQVTSDGVGEDGEPFHGDTRWKLTTTRTFDVDGDGIVDAFVPVPATKSTCPEELAWRVYAVRGRCGHDLGVVGPGWLVPEAMTMALDASGFRPLVLESRHPTYGKGHLPNIVTTTSSFGVVKGRYAKLATKRRGGLCHHCAIWRCTAATAGS